MYYSFTIQNENGTEKVKFGITKFPDRKQPCLYKSKGSVLYPLAYFKDEERAEEFNEILHMLYKLTL